METAKVLIVDDDGGFRQRVKGLLASEPHMEVVGEAAGGEEGILKARALEPTVVLMDVRMPGLNGLEATRRIKDELPDASVIILTMFDIEEYKEAARTSGASGFVVKKRLIEDLLLAIKDAVKESEPTRLTPTLETSLADSG
jgi:DNA-binding NarL/FixJ family response regulator